MDKFVTRTPREDDAAVAARKRAREVETDRPSSIAATGPVDAILESEAAAIALFESFPCDEWYDLGPWLLRRQLLFGQRGSYHRRSHVEEMPALLLDIYRHARAALQGHSDRFGDLPDAPSGCAVNRYETTANGKGSGLGPHRDKGSWRALVVGVTLGEARSMAFSDGYKADARVTHVVPTARASVYAFRDEIYSRWYHESLKKGPSQQRTVYSITYRFLP